MVTFASEAELTAVVSKLPLADAFWVGLDPIAGNANQYFSLASFEPGWAPTCPGCFAHTADASAPLPGAVQGCVESLPDLDASWQQVPATAATSSTSSANANRSESCPRSAREDSASTSCGRSARSATSTSAPTLRRRTPRRTAMPTGGRSSCFSRGTSESSSGTSYPRSRYPDPIWIGLSLKNGSWGWDDGAARGAYPSPWGDGEPKGSARGLSLPDADLIPSPLDNTLAVNDVAADSALAYVCQLPLPTAGSSNQSFFAIFSRSLATMFGYPSAGLSIFFLN